MQRYGHINLRYAFIGKMKSMYCTSLSSSEHTEHSWSRRLARTNEDCLYSSKAGKVIWHDGNNMKLKAGCKM